jgi:hypothetical protein
MGSPKMMLVKAGPPRKWPSNFQDLLDQSGAVLHQQGPRRITIRVPDSSTEKLVWMLEAKGFTNVVVYLRRGIKRLDQ